MKGSDVLTRARLVVNDPAATRWLDSEAALWVTDASRFVALKRPDSCAVSQAVALAAGTKQSIAALTPPGLRVLDVIRAVATGRAIRLVDREALDSSLPTWHAATPASPTNWVFDNRDPKTFYVYPPAPAAVEVEILYSRNPVTVTALELSTVDLSIDDIFIDPMVNYVLHRFYAKDADNAQNAALSSAYLAACEAALGAKSGTDVAYSPDLNNPGGKVSPGAAVGGA